MERDFEPETPVDYNEITLNGVVYVKKDSIPEPVKVEDIAPIISDDEVRLKVRSASQKCSIMDPGNVALIRGMPVVGVDDVIEVGYPDLDMKKSGDLADCEMKYGAESMWGPGHRSKFSVEYLRWAENVCRALFKL